MSALELIACEPTATDAATSPPPDSGGGGGGTVVDTWIIASDSQYVVTGATDWAWKRRARGWKKSKNAPEVGEIELSEEELALGKGLIPNADLWDRLLRGIMNVRGQVLFWLIEREWNQADSLASAGAVRIKKIFFLSPKLHYYDGCWLTNRCRDSASLSTSAAIGGRHCALMILGKLGRPHGFPGGQNRPPHPRLPPHHHHGYHYRRQRS